MNYKSHTFQCGRLCCCCYLCLSSKGWTFFIAKTTQREKARLSCQLVSWTLGNLASKFPRRSREFLNVQANKCSWNCVRFMAGKYQGSWNISTGVTQGRVHISHSLSGSTWQKIGRILFTPSFLSTLQNTLGWIRDPFEVGTFQKWLASSLFIHSHFSFDLSGSRLNI